MVKVRLSAHEVGANHENQEDEQSRTTQLEDSTSIWARDFLLPLATRATKQPNTKCVSLETSLAPTLVHL